MKSADFSEVRQLARDLDSAGARANREVGRVMRVGANKIKRGMRKDFRGLEHLPHLPAAINYDAYSLKPGAFFYEIGVDKNDDQGELGNIAAYGDGTHGPLVDHTAALHREAPHVVAHIADAGEQAPLGPKGRLR